MSSDKERLRSLVGLNGGRMNGVLGPGFPPSASNAAAVDVPNSGELLSLLQKQDQVIAELHAELEQCKGDLSSLKDRSASQLDQNNRLFDELRSQILKANLGKNLPPDRPVSSAVVLPRFGASGECNNCNEMRQMVIRLDKDKYRLQNNFLDTEAEVNRLRKADFEHARKVHESVALVDRAVLEKNEILIQLKDAQNRIKTLDKEVRDALNEHQQSLEQCRKSTREQYQTEIDTLKKQLSTLLDSETGIKTSVEELRRERDDLQNEKLTVVGHLTEIQTDADQKIKRLTYENEELAQKLAGITELTKDTQKALQQEIQEKTQKLQRVETQLEKQRVVSETATSSLAVKKREIADMRERMVSLEKELWQLRQWKLRLERERDELFTSKESEMKEAVRVAELKHDQTKVELERLLSSQNRLIYKLKEQCKLLTEQLEGVAYYKRQNQRIQGQPDVFQLTEKE